jgi:nicotinamide riboside kinase
MKLIGICGPARSGKDTLADNFVNIFNEQNVKSCKTSFAKQLKLECKDFLQKTIGIDSFTEEDSEKEIIRPLLVTWGTHVRRKLNPNVWVKSLESKINPNEITIISDVRFENEFNWIKENGGYIVFIDRSLPDGNLVQPANEDERINNIILRELSDHCFTWSTISEKDWLLAMSFEVLDKTVPEQILKSWIQTCH